jgi:hypothetical protein
MATVIEEALKLPKEEKLKLFHALQEELETEVVFREDELTKEQWAEINKRTSEIHSGKAKLISRNELAGFLNERRNSL